jgi:hypothetical protein
MGAVDLDGQSIEKRDFPIARRGYEPAAVDAHLRSVATAVIELTAKAQRGESVGAAAATQVQGILDAAQDAAAQIVSDAQQQADRTMQEAQLDAERTRSEAIAAAEAHLAAVAASAGALRSRVESMDAELHGLAETLRAGGGKLALELSAVERDMAALSAAASGRRAGAGEALASVPPAPVASPRTPEPAAAPVSAALPAPVAVAPPPPPPPPAPAAPPAPVASPEPVAPIEAFAPVAPIMPVAPIEAAAPVPTPLVQANGTARSADLDGARLIALNMALNGDSREATDRYLQQHFDLPEQGKLIDEVYAAIEG